MTLIVVDRWAVTADNYATVTHEGGFIDVIENFPKITGFHGGIKTPYGNTYPSIAFAGSAKVWMLVLNDLKQHRENNTDDQTVTLDDLIGFVERNVYAVRESILLVLPHPKGAYVLQGEVGSGMHVALETGEVLVYGGAYVKPKGSRPEYRAWYSIFFAAWRECKLPGTHVQRLHHGEIKPTHDQLDNPKRGWFNRIFGGANVHALH